MISLSHVIEKMTQTGNNYSAEEKKQLALKIRNVVNNLKYQDSHSNHFTNILNKIIARDNDLEDIAIYSRYLFSLLEEEDYQNIALALKRDLG